MTANHSQYMILDTDNNNDNMTVQQWGQQERNLAFERLPPICTTFSPSHQELEEIAQDQHPGDMPCEIRRRAQMMQRHLHNDSHRVTIRSERHEMVFDPVEASTPPRVTTPPVAAPPSPPPALQTETRPAWVIKLEQDLVEIEWQERQQQQAAQLVQQQTVMVEEVEDDKPLSYVEGTPQPLTEVPAFPGHYQIEFPGEQIEDKTNSDVEEIEPLPVPLEIIDLLVSWCPLLLLILLLFFLGNLCHHHYVYNHFPNPAFKAG